jgi:peptidoglycan/xylan/chitin deacetylase (PgdA/CDA1 family)
MGVVAPRRDLYYRRRRLRRRARAARWLTILVVPVVAGTLFALLTGWAPRDTVPAAPPPPADLPARPATKPKPARPPQFVIASFDGAGDAGLWRYWREVGRRTGARFTFFLSGVYLLGEERRVLYQPPQHEPGASDIGFMQRSSRASSARRIGELLVQLAEGRAEGHEIGTHFNGHFCAPYDGSVGEWTAGDWRQELAQFDELLVRASSFNGLDPVELGFGPADVVGARTPCLEGRLDVLHRVLREHGFRYDSSSSALPGKWPQRDHGIWSFPLPEIPLAGTHLRVISMDYNFMANQPTASTREVAKRLEEQTLASYLAAFEQSYRGNRAPFAVGNHFARWNHGAYVRALTRFLERVCRLSEVRCVPYTEVADWLDRHVR